MHSANEPIANFEKPALPIAHLDGFRTVRGAIEGAFSSGRVTDFLKSLGRGSLRIRDFESILDRGLLGSSTRTTYVQLGDGDRGQLREFYLAILEQVAPEIRQKFFKLYAYY